MYSPPARYSLQALYKRACSICQKFPEASALLLDWRPLPEPGPCLFLSESGQNQIWTSLLEVVEISSASILPFCRSKSTNTSLSSELFSSLAPMASQPKFKIPDRNNPCVSLTFTKIADFPGLSQSLGCLRCLSPILSPKPLRTEVLNLQPGDQPYVQGSVTFQQLLYQFIARSTRRLASGPEPGTFCMRGECVTTTPHIYPKTQGLFLSGMEVFGCDVMGASDKNSSVMSNLYYLQQTCPILTLSTLTLNYPTITLLCSNPLLQNMYVKEGYVLLYSVHSRYYSTVIESYYSTVIACRASSDLPNSLPLKVRYMHDYSTPAGRVNCSHNLATITPLTPLIYRDVNAIAGYGRSVYDLLGRDCSISLISNQDGKAPGNARQKRRDDKLFKADEEYEFSDLIFSNPQRPSSPRVSRVAQQDPEEMYEEIQRLKECVAAHRKEQNLKKTQIAKLEKELTKKDKLLDETLSQPRSTYGSVTERSTVSTESNSSLMGLRQKSHKLECMLRERDTEIRTLKSNLKSTKVQELEIMCDTYCQEITRLTRLIEQRDGGITEPPRRASTPLLNICQSIGLTHFSRENCGQSIGLTVEYRELKTRCEVAEDRERQAKAATGKQREGLEKIADEKIALEQKISSISGEHEAQKLVIRRLNTTVRKHEDDTEKLHKQLERDQATSRERLSHKSKVISELEDEIEKLQEQLRSTVQAQSENKENATPKAKKMERIESKKVESAPAKSTMKSDKTYQQDKTADVKTSQLITKKLFFCQFIGYYRCIILKLLLLWSQVLFSQTDGHNNPVGDAVRVGVTAGSSVLDGVENIGLVLVTQFPLHCGHAKTCLTFASLLQCPQHVATEGERLSHKSKVISELEDEIEKLQEQLRSTVQAQSENKENATPKAKKMERIESKKVESAPAKSTMKSDKTYQQDKTADVKTSQLITKKLFFCQFIGYYRCIILKLLLLWSQVLFSQTDGHNNPVGDAVRVGVTAGSSVLDGVENIGSHTGPKARCELSELSEHWPDPILASLFCTRSARELWSEHWPDTAFIPGVRGIHSWATHKDVSFTWALGSGVPILGPPVGVFQNGPQAPWGCFIYLGSGVPILGPPVGVFHLPGVRGTHSWATHRGIPQKSCYFRNPRSAQSDNKKEEMGDEALNACEGRREQQNFSRPRSRCLVRPSFPTENGLDALFPSSLKRSNFAKKWQSYDRKREILTQILTLVCDAPPHQPCISCQSIGLTRFSRELWSEHWPDSVSVWRRHTPFDSQTGSDLKQCAQIGSAAPDSSGRTRNISVWRRHTPFDRVGGARQEHFNLQYDYDLSGATIPHLIGRTTNWAHHICSSLFLCPSFADAMDT
eukprot:sb/3461021/